MGTKTGQFGDYLKTKIVKGKGKTFTHTRIGDKNSNIYGGLYNVPDEEYNLFMDNII